MITIETNIPLPDAKRGSSAAYPFADMQVGDSFFVASAEADFKATRARLAAAIARFRKASEGVKFATRTVDEDSVNGLRVWRMQ